MVAWGIALRWASASCAFNSSVRESAAGSYVSARWDWEYVHRLWRVRRYINKLNLPEGGSRLLLRNLRTQLHYTLYEYSCQVGNFQRRYG
jgi:hypothetical protein